MNKLNNAMIKGFVMAWIFLMNRAPAMAQIAWDEANDSELSGFFDSIGNIVMSAMMVIGIITFAILGVQLTGEKEIRDVKKGLIGSAMLIFGPILYYALADFNPGD